MTVYFMTAGQSLPDSPMRRYITVLGSGDVTVASGGVTVTVSTKGLPVPVPVGAGVTVVNGNCIVTVEVVR